MPAKNESGKFLKSPAVNLNQNRKAESCGKHDGGDTVIRWYYNGYVN
jgi:hypothetical protein